MGFFDDLKSAFSGGSSKKSGSGSKSKSNKSSTPTFKSLSEAAKAGYHGQAVNIAGKGKQKVSFGDKSYDKKMAAASNAASKSSSSGIAALKNAPKNIARDIGMGVGLTKRDADYYRRTADTIARTQGAAAADRYIKQMTAKGGDAAAGVKNADVSGSVNYGQRIGMLNKDGSVNKNYMSSDDGGIASLKNANTEADDMSDQYAENLRRYEEYMKSQQQTQQPAITPEMRQAALQTFESQQGAGQVPYYMAAARNAQNPNMSPAFQYAAQNYDVLGGSQRLGPRPMEMMSVAERRQINDMAQAMADQQAQQQAQQMDYQRGMDMVIGGGGKGGPRTGPQLPPGMVGLPRTPDYGGGMPRPPLPFASILASRFGGFGG